MTIKFNGQLEIDVDRGVIYFHDAKTGLILLRICSLPTPIPTEKRNVLGHVAFELLDITHMHGVSWK